MDIQAKISGHVKNNRIPGLDYDIAFYADEAILLSRDNRGLNELLKYTEQISAGYGLKLNRTHAMQLL